MTRWVAFLTGVVLGTIGGFIMGLGIAIWSENP